MDPVSHWVSLAKAFTWRVLGSTVTGLIGWYLTGRWQSGVILGTAEFGAKIFLYWFHERVWVWLERRVRDAVTNG